MAKSSTQRALGWYGFALGFALGGFFDGILLHQVLQWHHLLSNVEAAQDLRTQILADGLFHVLMYFIAAFALYKLWRHRAKYADPGADRVLWGNALIGFGVWHIFDSFLSHWITGIHRIKIDSPNPLFWDLVWFFVFGLAPAVLGWLMLRRGTGNGRRGAAAAAGLGIVTLVAGPLAALPVSQSDHTVVVFAPGVTSGEAFNALAKVDARVLWSDRQGGMWAVKMKSPTSSWSLYRDGAMLVSNSTIALGCLSWTQLATRG